MNKNQITLAKTLTYSGTLPLIASVIARYLPLAELNSTLIAETYSAIIISFLCGIHWAIYLFFAEKCPRNLLITSNMVALLAWASLLVRDQSIALLLQALCFLYLLTLDLKLRDAGIVSQWFYQLRRNATVIVVLCLVMLAGVS
jgi:hypothetical protein